MSAPPDIQNKLQSLSIPREQRPETSGGARTGRPFRNTLIVLMLIIAAGAVGYSLQTNRATIKADSDSAPRVRVIRIVANRALSGAATLTATGKIVSDHLVEVATKVSGQIVALEFEQGDQVSIGSVLARLEDISYKARRDQAAAQLEKARANLTFQKVNFERVSELYGGGSAPGIEFSDARRALDESKAQVAAQTAALAFAQKALDDCVVNAPISGVVLERNVEVGDFVAAEGGRAANANAQFAIIADMTALRVEVDVSELDIARITKGMRCVVTPDAYKDRKYPGFVMWIDPGANYSKATVQTKVRIENPDEFLRVEGSAQVAFLAESNIPETTVQMQKGIWIPITSIREGETESSGTVLAIVDDRIRETKVTLGERRGELVEILNGLSKGAMIVAVPVSDLRDGQTIRSFSPNSER